MIERSLGFPRLWLSLCAGLTLLILWLALLPANSAPSGFGWDKLNHAGAIAVATGLAYLSFQPCRWAAVAAFLYGISLGGLIEVLLDWLAMIISHIPRHGEQMVRYYGYYSNAARGKRRKFGMDDSETPEILGQEADTPYRNNCRAN